MRTEIMLKLRNDLCAKGYLTATIANWDCFDINQNGYVHYLSYQEATMLLTAKGLKHPVNLHDYGTYDGTKTIWYDFKVTKEVIDDTSN